MSNQDNLNFDGAEWVKDEYVVKTQQDIDFLVAFRNEDYEKAEQLLKDGANVNVCDKKGKTEYKAIRDWLNAIANAEPRDMFAEMYDVVYGPEMRRKADFLDEHGGELETWESMQIASNYSKLGQLRKKIAKGIDDTLETHLEDVSLPLLFKELIEKPISNMVLGKLKDRDR
ncbi:MAG: hypothetical protein IJ852_06440 [Alphaproteobacteria bacterium]|nr:hypothetical protein [Alphaproteobacteria bacterium]